MAVDLPDRESLLKPVFLSEEDESVKPITNIWGEHELSGSGVSELDSCSEVTGDDDYIAELTRQMSQYMFKEAAPDKQSKTWGLSSSPQSTLRSPFGYEKQRLVGGVPETEYPPIQVARNKKTRQDPQRPKPPPLANANPNPQQQPAPAGTRVLFLGGSGLRSGSPGTGVFLPRGNNPSQSSKNLGCSRVVIPARVAQALKLHFEHVVSKPKSITDLQRDTINNESENDNKGSADKQKQQLDLEVALPQEWTY